MSLGDDRYDYAKSELIEENAGHDPLALFTSWLEDARAAGVIEPAAFCLSTADENGVPSARFVLLRVFDERGFVFFSHYDGRKGREMEANPRAAMTFWWGGLERQIRIEGRVERASEEESDAYWLTRPPKSRIASAASPQSEEIESRETLEALVAAEAERHSDGLPRPENWGGTRVVPERIEFWQGRRSRLHDRILFIKRVEAGASGWDRVRLAP